MSVLGPRSGIQVSSVYPTYTHIKGLCPLCVCVCVCVCVCACVCVCVCVCVAKPVAVELRCHATALILEVLSQSLENHLSYHYNIKMGCFGIKNFCQISYY